MLQYYPIKLGCMSFIPLSQGSTPSTWQAVRLIATDMDKTITVSEQFTPMLLHRLEALAIAGLDVIIVTGRSAGWVSGIAHYLPVKGAIAENGGIFYTPDTEQLLQPIADLSAHRQALAATFAKLQAQFPQICESSDNQFRKTDWTFDVTGLSKTDLQTMDAICQAQGWSFTYSTVQCHIKLPQQSKATGILQVMQTHFPQYTLAQTVTVGDSPNDESMFDSAIFPLSVGVANVLHYRDQLRHQPVYITDAAEGKGFCELADRLIATSGAEKL
jgi:HAD superfamily hydrolase (TIGR01484 family)